MKTMPLILVFIMFFSACTYEKERVEGERKKLNEVCNKINSDFKRLIPEIDESAAFTEKLYNEKNIEENLKKVNKNSYAISKDGVFYRKNNKSKSAVFVSGFIPLNEEIKKEVYFTEVLDDFFQKKTEKNKEIVQIYYDSKNSYCRIYPWFDVLTQFQPKMDMTSYNFYYLADEKHNPMKKAVWVNEPYIDLAGRGWMISLLKPVYVNGKLQGVSAVDITINEIMKKYLIGENKNIVIISKQGTIVALSDKEAEILSLPVLKKQSYIETLTADTYMPDNFNLLKSKQKSIRNLTEKIIKGEKESAVFEFENKRYNVIWSEIKELKWIGIKFIKQ